MAIESFPVSAGGADEEARREQVLRPLREHFRPSLAVIATLALRLVVVPKSGQA